MKLTLLVQKAKDRTCKYSIIMWMFYRSAKYEKLKQDHSDRRKLTKRKSRDIPQWRHALFTEELWDLRLREIIFEKCFQLFSLTRKLTFLSRLHTFFVFLLLLSNWYLHDTLQHRINAFYWSYFPYVTTIAKPKTVTKHSLLVYLKTT